MKSEKTILHPAKWVDNYGDLLYSYTVKRVADQGVAEDIVQDTFLAALKSKERFKGESTEKTWLFAILKNKIIDHFRKKSKLKEDQTNFSLPFKEQGSFYKHWEKDRGPKSWHIQGDNILEAEDFRRIFKWCFENLPPKLASVFALKVIEDTESDEVCKELGISSSNFWVLMHRARLQLRECMEEKWMNQ